MRHATVRSDLGVNVAALLLVQVDLCLQDIDFLRLTFELSPEQVFLHLDVALLLLIFIIENILVIAIKLLVERQLVFTEILDHVQKVRISRDSLCKLTLRCCKICLSFLLLQIASLLHLMELVLQVEHDLRWATDLQRVQIDDIAEPQHLTLPILSDLLVALLVVLRDLLALFLVVLLGFELLFAVGVDFFIELQLAMNEFEKLRPGEQDRVIERRWHKVTSVVL